MDEIFNKLESGEAAIGAYYAGDYFTMVDARQTTWTLQFYYPEPTNYLWTPCASPPAARTRSWRRSSSTTCSARRPLWPTQSTSTTPSPNSLVYDNETYQEDMGEEAMAILYPEGEDFATAYNQLAYRNLSNDMLDYVNTLWENLKIN